MLIGNEIIEAGKYLGSHYGIHDETHLGRLSHVVNLPDVTISILNNYIADQLNRLKRN